MEDYGSGYNMGEMMFRVLMLNYLQWHLAVCNLLPVFLLPDVECVVYTEMMMVQILIHLVLQICMPFSLVLSLNLPWYAMW